MTLEEFIPLAKGMKAIYTEPKFLPDNFSVQTWYQLLKDLPYDVASAAIQYHMSNSEFPPTVASIRKIAADNITKENNVIGENEAWGLVYKAISNSIYHADEEFAKLPPTCQRVIGSHENLRALATMDIEKTNTVEQSHFIREYRRAADEAKTEGRLPEKLRQFINAEIKTAKKPSNNLVDERKNIEGGNIPQNDF